MAVTTRGVKMETLPSDAINQSGMAHFQGEMLRKLKSQEFVGTGAQALSTGIILET